MSYSTSSGLEISYRIANQRDSRESAYIRVEDASMQMTPVILIDSGEGVDVEKQLSDDEYLAAVLLTHAHNDHYCTLPENLIDGAPVYTSPDTAAIMETVLSESERNGGVSGDVSEAVRSIEGIEEWTQIVPRVSVRPLSVGHAPGASGFVLKLDTKDGDRFMLVTGDFDMRPCAGYPGMPETLPFDVETVFANTATTDSKDDTLDESLSAIVEYAQGGMTTVVAVDGLVGVHYAYLLGHLIEELNEAFEVVLVGQPAKLYNALDYDIDAVRTVETFTSTDDLVGPEKITIAAPSKPTGGSSKKMLQSIMGDSNAMFVQITAGGELRTRDIDCSSVEFHYQRHPSKEQFDEFIENLIPYQFIALHSPSSEYGSEYDFCFEISPEDGKYYNLYEDGEFLPPHWLRSNTASKIDDSRAEMFDAVGGRVRDTFETAMIGEFPSVGRSDTPSLEAEGADMSLFNVAQPTEPETPTAPKQEAEVAEVAETSKPDVAAMDGGAATDSNGGDSSTESPEQPIPLAEESPPLLDSINRRLKSIETILQGDTLSATVVDAGDDVMLLRVDSPPENLSHGNEVQLQLLNN